MGSIGGAVSVFVGFPLDTIKVRLQLSEAKPSFRYLTSTLYKGVSSPLLAVPPSWAINFLFYGGVIRLLGGADLTSVAIAGGAAGIANAFVMCPFEFVKINVQRAAGQKSVNILSVMRAQKNPLALYRGMSMQVARDFCEGTAYFYTLERATRSDVLGSTFGTRYHAFVAGALTGITHVTCGFHFDCIKTCYQSNAHLTYKEAIRGLYAEGGIPRFYKGYAASILRAVLAHGCGATFMNAIGGYM